MRIKGDIEYMSMRKQPNKINRIKRTYPVINALIKVIFSSSYKGANIIECKIVSFGNH